MLRKQNKFTDCSFKADNGVINCHKLILSAASPVFEVMFYGKFSEVETMNSIKITDISLETFEMFVDYIYTGELNVNSCRELKSEEEEINCLLNLSYCAQKYLIEDLKLKCVEKLSDFLKNDTVLMVLNKSFDMHLDDDLVASLYFIVDALEAGKTLVNVILNNEEFHLTSSCFEFLVKNLIDYFGSREVLMCLIKSWCFMECQLENLPYDDQSMAVALSKLNLEESLEERVMNLDSADIEKPPSDSIFRMFHRVYYKPIRPFIIEDDQMSFDLNLSFKRFIIINSISINSRLIPEQFDICDVSSQQYVENITVEILTKNTNKSVYKQHHTINNISYNSFFKISFNEKIILFPHCIYTVKLSWPLESIGYEYPRCIFSLKEKGGDEKLDCKKNPLSVVQFHEYNYIWNSPAGSIVQGISYDLIS